MEKLRAGVTIALENLTNSAVLDTNDRRMICSNNMELLSEAEKNIYRMTCDDRENHVQMFSYSFSQLDNSRKRLFVGIFDKNWKYHTDSNEFLVKDSKIGFDTSFSNNQNDRGQRWH